MLDQIAVELGLDGNASAAIRQVMRQKHRDLFPQPGVVERLVKETKRLTSLGPAAEQVKKIKAVASATKDASARHEKASRALRGAAARKPKK